METRDEAGGDALVRTLSDDGGIAVRALAATELVREAAARHGTSALATLAFGRVLMGAVLLGAGGKHGETVQVRFRGGGPLRTLLAIATAEAQVRGYVGDPAAGSRAALSVAQGIGLGDLSVVRHRPGWTEPYTGIVPIVSGEVGEDLALYLTESEQTPSAVALGVQLDEDGRVIAAGGFLAQALPDANPDVLDRLEANVRSLPAPSELIKQGAGARLLAERLLEGIGGRELESVPACYHCNCNRDRVIRAVALLGRQEVEELRALGEDVEVRCEFCGERYEIDPDHVRALFPDA